MKAIIRLNIGSAYGSLATIEREEVVPDGLYTREGIDTSVSLTSDDKSRLRLSVTNYDLDTKIATLCALSTIWIFKDIGAEGVDELLNSFRLFGWTVDTNEKVLTKLKTSSTVKRFLSW